MTCSDKYLDVPPFYQANILSAGHHKASESIKHIRKNTYVKTEGHTLDLIKEIKGQSLGYSYRTYGGNAVTLPFEGDGNCNYSASDMANHLGKIVYFPESGHAPFTAAQYAVELAKGVWTKYGPIVQLHALLQNAHEAYLGHVPLVARLAEKAMTTPPLVTDRRDALEETVHARILRALQIPDLGSLTGTARNVIFAARMRLDETLVRDIGAAKIDHYDRNLDMQPLPRIIRPQPWDHAIERYLKTYRELTALCGLPAVE